MRLIRKEQQSCNRNSQLQLLKAQLTFNLPLSHKCSACKTPSSLTCKSRLGQAIIMPKVALTIRRREVRHLLYQKPKGKVQPGKASVQINTTPIKKQSYFRAQNTLLQEISHTILFQMTRIVTRDQVVMTLLNPLRL